MGTRLALRIQDRFEALTPAEQKLAAEVTVLRPPTFARLQEALAESPGRFHILHFDGHGGYGPPAQPPPGGGGGGVAPSGAGGGVAPYGAGEGVPYGGGADTLP